MAQSTRTRIRKGSKTRQAYDHAHKAWRAGAIDDFYYGRRGPGDNSIVWRFNGVEFDKREDAVIVDLVDEALRRNGIESVEFGDKWVGYPALIVNYTNGDTRVDEFDGRRIVTREIPAQNAIREAVAA